MLVLPKVDEALKVMLIRVIFSYEFNLDIESLILSLRGLTVQSSLASQVLGADAMNIRGSILVQIS